MLIPLKLNVSCGKETVQWKIRVCVHKLLFVYIQLCYIKRLNVFNLAQPDWTNRNKQSTINIKLPIDISLLFIPFLLSIPGWFFSLRDADPENDDIYFWMSPTWITLIFASFNLGLGPISWSLLGDTLPEQLKTPVVSVAVAFGWLISLMATLTFDEMIISLGGTKVMWLSAAICWLTGLFCAIVAKDNTGKSLIEIQENFRIESNRDLARTW